jgi:uncharacterized protein
MNNKWIHMVAFALLVVGGLNWGLVGLFEFNLVETIFGANSTLTMVVYVLVGLSAAVIAATHMNDCKVCGKK